MWVIPLFLLVVTGSLTNANITNLNRTVDLSTQIVKGILVISYKSESTINDVFFALSANESIATHLDTTDRTVIVLQKDHVDKHIQPFTVYYDFDYHNLLPQPFLASAFFFLLFLLIIIYSHHDFTIFSKWFSTESAPSIRGKTFIIDDSIKIEQRDCGCTLYEYHTGDIFWKRLEVEVYYYMRSGMNEVRFTTGPVIRLFQNGQFDFIHADGQATSIRSDGTRLEKKLDVSARWVCQKFTPDRDPLRNGANITFGYDGMEICFTDGGFVKISTETLRISLWAPQDEGKISHVAMKDKTPCFYWGRQKRYEDCNQVLDDDLNNFFALSLLSGFPTS